MYKKKKAASKPRAKPKARAAAPRRKATIARAPRQYDYPGAGAAIGGAIGSLAGPLGATIGGVLGGGAQALLKKVTGFGDYEISHNSVLLAQDTVPMFGGGKRSNMVRHREYIQDIVSSATAGQFKSDVFPIQPALPSSFPWLNALASNYDQYRLHGMVYEFKTMSSDALNSTNTALGTVIMATQYNVLEKPFDNKQQMENYEFGVSTKPSCSLIHPIECARFQTPVDVLFTRSGPVTQGDLRLYDMGNMTIATQGLQGTSVTVGELWVSYDIELLKPRLVQSTSDGADHYSIPDPTNVTAAAYFGATPPLLFPSSSSSFGTSLEAPGKINLPAGFIGKVMVYYCITGTAAAAGVILGPNISVTAGVTGVDLLAGNSTNLVFTPQVSVPAAGDTTVVSAFSVFDVTIGGKFLNLTGMNLAGLATVTTCDLIVASFPESLTN